jgi:uncharacterized protein involved in exopolysaccharide biosynthesis
VAASNARNVPMGGVVSTSVGTSRRSRVNADTTAEPEGLTRRVVLNILEAFFRRPWLHLLPLILMLALGGVTAFSKKPVYTSTGALTAESSTLIGSLTQSNNQGFGFDTPATATARNINELLRTNDFLNTVATKLNPNGSDSEKALLRTVIARSVGAFADGDQLVRVRAQTERADLAAVLASATIDSYLNTIENNEIRQSDSTVQFFQGQVDQAKQARDAAQQTLNDFLVQNNITGDAAQVPLSLSLQAESLRSDFNRLDNVYNTKVDQLSQAELARETAKTEVEQRLRITDAPQPPVAPEPRLRKAFMTLVIFGVLGVLLSLASVIVAATLDRTIRIPGDVTAKFGLDVLAVVPNARAR